MINPQDFPKSGKVTLEELLRLKRSERAAPEFWPRFEKDLRSKQLAAIVEKRTWWERVGVLAFIRERGVPLGAAAAMVLGLLVAREFPSISKVYVSTTESVNVAVVDPALSWGRGVEMSLTDLEWRGAHDRKSDLVSELESASDLASSTSVPGQSTKDQSTAMASRASLPSRKEKILAMDQPEAVGELAQLHFASVVTFSSEHRFDGRVEIESLGAPLSVANRKESPAPTSVSVKEVPVSPREIRSKRILANIVLAGDVAESLPARSSPSREVFSGAVLEDQFNDRASRIGMGGDRLILKF